MMNNENVLVAYVGASSKENLRHGIKKGIWGFKDKVMNIQDENIENMYFILGHRYSGGSPRTSEEKWNQNSIESLYLCKITTNFYSDHSVEWPDEKEMADEERYCWRFNFDVLEKIKDVELSKIDEEISNKLRMSAIAQSRGYLIKNVSENRLEMFMNALANNNEQFNHLKLKEDLDSINLQYSEELILRFSASLLAKPLVLLTGLSGSGKTKLAQAFVQWITQDSSQYAIVSVGANWINRDPLLGYKNALDDEAYIYPDNKCLDLLIDAFKLENQNKPYFLILDEMNLSHVERYFADFLSTMESDEPIRLHTNSGSINGIPQYISISSNIFIIGTVNIDETTYMFSPKVLDRAHVLEFTVTSDMMESFLDNPTKINMDDLTNNGFRYSNNFMELYRKNYKDIHLKEEIKQELLSFFNELSKIGAEYGFRTASDIFRYIEILKQLNEDISDEQCIDYAIVQKLLPKLHGSRKKLQPVLKTLGNMCLKNNLSFIEYVSEKPNDLEEKIKYPISLTKLERMYNRLISNGFTSFAEA